MRGLDPLPEHSRSQCVEVQLDIGQLGHSADVLPPAHPATGLTVALRAIHDETTTTIDDGREATFEGLRQLQGENSRFVLGCIHHRLPRRRRRRPPAGVDWRRVADHKQPDRF